jgi:hypothetical protein
MALHIIINQERRTAQETPFGGLDTSRLAIVAQDQLHTLSYAALPANLDDPQFVMVAEWDERSDFVIQHKGDYSARTMGYAGWPEEVMEGGT